MARLKAIVIVFLITGGLLCLGFEARADTALGFDVSGGVGTSGFDASASVDVQPRPDEKTWEASLTYAYLHSTTGTPSLSNQAAVGLDHSYNDHWEGHTNLTYWQDNLNKVSYVGPSLGFTYTWNEGGTEEGNEIAALTLDSDLFVYTTDAISTGTLRTVRDPVTHRLTPKLLGAGTAAQHTTQFHPSLTFEKPLWGVAVTPYLIAGHYFYSQDPAAIESIAGRPRFAASSTQLNSLVGGLLNNNGSVGVRLPIGRLTLIPSISAEQSATDLTWSTVQDVTLKCTWWGHIKTKLDWSRTIQTGETNDLFTGGVTYLF